MQGSAFDLSHGPLVLTCTVTIRLPHSHGELHPPRLLLNQRCQSPDPDRGGNDGPSAHSGCIDAKTHACLWNCEGKQWRAL